MAEEYKRDVVIEVIVNSEDAVKNIAAAKKEIEGLKAANKELAASEDDNSVAIARNNEQIKQLNKVIAANSKEVQNNIQRQKTQDGSLKQMRAQLKLLREEYDGLSRTERESAKGTELLDKIQQTDESLKKAEFASGRFQSNVGNYPQFLGRAGNALVGWINNIHAATGGATTLSGAMKNAITSVANFGKALLALNAIPIVALISAIVLIITKLIKALKKNDEAMTRLQQAFASLQPIITVLNKILEFLSTVLAEITYWSTKAANAVLLLIPAFRNAATEAEKLVLAEDALEEAERQYTVNSAERQREIAELRDKTVQKDKYTVEERKKMLQQAMDLELEDLQEKQAIAKEELRIAEEKAKQDADTSDETMNRIADLKAAVINAETDYYTARRKLDREMNTFMQEQQREADEIKRKAEEDAKARAEAYKQYVDKMRTMRDKETAERRKATDIELGLMLEGRAKEEAILAESYKRMQQDLKLRLKEEENLTKEARAEIQRQMILLRSEYELKMAEIADKYGAEEFERLRNRYRMQIEVAGDNLHERYNLERELLRKERDNAIAEASKKGEDVLLVQKYYAQKERELNASEAREYEQLAARQADLELRELQNNLAWQLQQTTLTEQAKLEIQRKYAEERLNNLQTEAERIRTMSEEEKVANYGTLEEWKAAWLNADAAVIEANEQVMESQRAVTEYQQQQQLAIGQSFAKVSSTIQGVFDTLAETDERYADFATGMAMANILTSSAVAIAEAVASATKAGAFTGMAAPATIPIFIAELVSIVGSAIAGAISTLSKAKEARAAAKYATGGYVEGPGSGTSDSIPARLSRGEFVVNAEGTRRNLPLLVAMNGGWGNSGGRKFAAGGMVGMDAAMGAVRMDAVRAIMVDAVKSVQPVVSVKEITTVSNRVKVKEQIAKQ